MKSHAIRSFLLVGLVGLAAPSTTYAISYNYTTINVPGSAYTIASGINNAGQIVGLFADSSGT